MTSYNRESYISEAILSILNQSYKNFELIIVDDCSSDSTFEIAESYAIYDSRIRLFSNPINLAHRILFESGDVLIFGGPSRHIHHCVDKIYDQVGYRLNFTFRYAPALLGEEEKFSSKNFKSVYSKFV